MKHAVVRRWAERLAWTVGLAAIGVWSAAGVFRHVGSAHELRQFAQVSRAAPAPVAGAPNLALWAPERIRAWQDAQRDTSHAPLAVLRIARLDIQAPILEGTDEWALNRGVGHIEDTARPGADGNTGIAGHRDGFFRALKDITAGDVLDIETPGSIAHYQVERTWIVGPDDVSVLDPTPTPSVTLVTCYPFYFVGSAPQRFIVRAVRTETLSARAARN